MVSAFRPRARAVLAIVAALLLLPCSLTAQTASSASITGRAVGDEGEPRPGLEVVVVHPATGATARTLTDPAGRFRVVNLAAGGPYTLRVRGLGVRETVREEIRLLAGQVLRLEIQVSADVIAIQGIEVRGERTSRVIDPSRTGAATFVDAAAIEATPTLSRNVMDLADLSALVRRSDGFSIAGQNDRYNALRLDGANIQDVFGLSPSGVAGGQSDAKPVPLAAVEQYQVLVSPFEVRHSGFTGGLVNAVTRGGTNEWRGEIFSQRRDERLVGDFQFDGELVRPAYFLREMHGGWAGGPLVRDRLHLLVAAEFERRRHPTAGISFGDADPLTLGISPDSLARLMPILDTLYGIDPGVAERFPLENPLTNVFARLDWQPAPAQRVSLRLNLARAEEDISPLRQRGAEYGLSSTSYRYASRTRGGTLQWNARLPGGVGNELLVHLQDSRESNEPGTDLPLVQLDLWSHFGSARFNRVLEFGANPVAHASRLNQQILQVANQLAFGVGPHELALGLSFERFGVRNLSVPGALGVYRFDSLEDLERNRPALFQRQLVDPDDGTPPLILYQIGAYLQDEWEPFDSFRLQAGMRVDLPVLNDLPRENTHLRRVFGSATTDMPTAFAMVSPRVGFNWQRDAEHRTQIRGGAGIFAGRPPLAWLAQAYDQTGQRGGWLICSGTAAPPLDPGAPLPTTCRGAPPQGQVPRPAVVVDRGFRFPQDLRASFGVDQELPGALVASVEAVFTRAINQVHLMDLNIGDRLRDPLHPVSFPAHLGRRSYFGPATGAGFRPEPVASEYQQVLLLTNRARNQSFTLGGELQRGFGQALRMRAAYAYTRAFDTQSLTSADLARSFGRTAISGDPNDPDLRPSHYDQPHKVVVSTSSRARHALGESRFSLIYNGQSGTPYSYVYLDDVNGDGYPGAGGALGVRNDLIYVPAFPGEVPVAGSHAVALHRLIESEPCLAAARGQVLQRNACRTPFSHILDARTSHAVRLPGGIRGEVTADLINVLNLLNPGWGHVYRAPASIPVLAHTGRTASGLTPVPTDPLEPFWFVGPMRSQADGTLLPARAYAPVFPESQWQAQLGLSLKL